MNPALLLRELRETGIPVVEDPEELSALATDRTGTGGVPLILAEPRSTDEVQSIILLCRRFKTPVVPQGGRTGYAGAACSSGGDLLLSLRRMNQIHELDPYTPSLHVDAGCITRSVQDYAREHGYYFPVDFASAGSSMIGGNAATNAGGIRFVRYGGMRHHVLGLQAVTGSGDIIQTNGRVRKDNTGYNIRDLLIGSEGTLAVITQLTLNLLSTPEPTLVLLCGMRGLEAILQLLALAKREGVVLDAFEVLDRRCFESVMKYSDLPDPFAKNHTWYTLLEFAAESPATRRFMNHPELLRITTEALPADSDSAKARFWKYRENISESLSHGPIHKNDISIPLIHIPEYEGKLRSMLDADYDEMEVFLFGHIADGNLHINLKPIVDSNSSLAEDHSATDQTEKRSAGKIRNFRESCEAFDERNAGLIQSFGGSISAEHGIGTLKKKTYMATTGKADLERMRQIKKAFDPDGIMNPGKIFDL